MTSCLWGGVRNKKNKDDEESLLSMCSVEAIGIGNKRKKTMSFA
jgi:hypothetical protein